MAFLPFVPEAKEEPSREAPAGIWGSVGCSTFLADLLSLMAIQGNPFYFSLLKYCKHTLHSCMQAGFGFSCRSVVALLVGCWAQLDAELCCQREERSRKKKV